MRAGERFGEISAKRPHIQYFPYPAVRQRRMRDTDLPYFRVRWGPTKRIDPREINRMRYIKDTLSWQWDCYELLHGPEYVAMISDEWLDRMAGEIEGLRDELSTARDKTSETGVQGYVDVAIGRLKAYEEAYAHVKAKSDALWARAGFMPEGRVSGGIQIFRLLHVGGSHFPTILYNAVNDAEDKPPMYQVQLGEKSVESFEVGRLLLAPIEEDPKGARHGVLHFYTQNDLAGKARRLARTDGHYEFIVYKFLRIAKIAGQGLPASASPEEIRMIRDSWTMYSGDPDQLNQNIDKLKTLPKEVQKVVNDGVLLGFYIKEEFRTVAAVWWQLATLGEDLARTTGGAAQALATLGTHGEPDSQMGKFRDLQIRIDKALVKIMPAPRGSGAFLVDFETQIAWKAPNVPDFKTGEITYSPKFVAVPIEATPTFSDHSLINEFEIVEGSGEEDGVSEEQQQLSWADNKRGAQLLAGGEHKKAEQAFREALEHNPANFGARGNLVASLWEQGRKFDAVEEGFNLIDRGSNRPPSPDPVENELRQTQGHGGYWHHVFDDISAHYARESRAALQNQNREDARNFANVALKFRPDSKKLKKDLAEALKPRPGQ